MSNRHIVNQCILCTLKSTMLQLTRPSKLLKGIRKVYNSCIIAHKTRIFKAFSNHLSRNKTFSSSSYYCTFSSSYWKALSFARFQLKLKEMFRISMYMGSAILILTKASDWLKICHDSPVGQSQRFFYTGAAVAETAPLRCAKGLKMADDWKLGLFLVNFPNFHKSGRQTGWEKNLSVRATFI